ncbi:MAG: hypothetical protein ABSF23_07375 [Terracidiphilus sp.]|jgi:hypothetical protein
MPAIRNLARFAFAAALCACLHAQTANTISLRVLDGKTGLPVKASNFLVLVDHRQTVHNEWVKIGDDGTVLVTLPADAKEFSVKATYDMGMTTYIDCDAAKETDKERDIWYPVSLILRNGVVAPNECGRTDFDAKPGEFIFFVRKRDWHDHPED